MRVSQASLVNKCTPDQCHYRTTILENCPWKLALNSRSPIRRHICKIWYCVGLRFGHHPTLLKALKPAVNCAQVTIAFSIIPNTYLSILPISAGRLLTLQAISPFPQTSWSLPLSWLFQPILQTSETLNSWREDNTCSFLFTLFYFFWLTVNIHGRVTPCEKKKTVKKILIFNFENSTGTPVHGIGQALTLWLSIAPLVEAIHLDKKCYEQPKG